MRGAVSAMLDRYPAATLQDIYKSMFQDRFGVAHMLGSREAVVAYIERELLMLEDSDDGRAKADSYFEPCGWRGDFVRVDLRAVRDGAMSVDELATMFINSANEAPEADSFTLRAWAAEWDTILEACYASLSAIEGFQRDSTLLAAMIARGEYVVHHSRRYNDHYAPHYRIVHKSQVESVLQSIARPTVER